MTTLRRGQRRFREPLDSRYDYYMVPSKLDGKCRNCGGPLEFLPDHLERKAFDPEGGGYRVVNAPITGAMKGRGTCLTCGAIVRSISWPEDALYKVPLAGGDLWVWNREYLMVLLAKISGDRTKERHIRHEQGFRMNGYFSYFLARLPKHVLIKRNRAYLVKEITRLLSV